MPEVALHFGHWIIFLSNVPDELSLLASGTKACSAGDVPEVPQAQGLAPSARSAFLLSFQFVSAVWTMKDS